MANDQAALEFWPVDQWTDEERLVWDCIRHRHGAENAIAAREIARITGIGSDRDGRRVRHIVKHLIEYHRLPIASTCGSPAGYFRPWGAQEVDDCVRWLMGFAKSTLLHASVLKRSANLDRLLGQLELEMPPEKEKGGL